MAEQRMASWPCQMLGVFRQTDSNDTTWEAGKHAQDLRLIFIVTTIFVTLGLQDHSLCIPTWQGLSIVILDILSLVVSMVVNEMPTVGSGFFQLLPKYVCMCVCVCVCVCVSVRERVCVCVLV